MMALVWFEPLPVLSLALWGTLSTATKSCYVDGHFSCLILLFHHDALGLWLYQIHNLIRFFFHSLKHIYNLFFLSWCCVNFRLSLACNVPIVSFWLLYNGMMSSLFFSLNLQNFSRESSWYPPHYIENLGLFYALQDKKWKAEWPSVCDICFWDRRVEIEGWSMLKLNAKQTDNLRTSTQEYLKRGLRGV